MTLKILYDKRRFHTSWGTCYWQGCASQMAISPSVTVQ